MNGNIQILNIKVERNDVSTDYVITFRPKTAYTSGDIDKLLADYKDIKSINVSN